MARTLIKGGWVLPMDDAIGDGLDRRQKLFEQIHPDIDFRVIKGAGHWVMYETPEIFNAMVREMVERA